jgi:hypothetical protein
VVRKTLRYRIEAALGRLAQERTTASRRLALLLGGVEVDADRLEGALPLTPSSLDVGACRPPSALRIHRSR